MTGLYDFTAQAIDGSEVSLGQYRGKVVLVVNTASKCGLTPQYEGLEKLHRTVSPRGLTVIGVPSQDFNQESADNKTVKTFCDATFGVEFPMAAIAHVRGAQAAPFYAWVREQKNWQPAWNFNKVLIGRDGRIAGTFGSGDEPEGPKLSGAIDAELAKA